MWLFAVDARDRGVSAFGPSGVTLAGVGYSIMGCCAYAAHGLVLAERDGVSVLLAVATLGHQGGRDKWDDLAFLVE